MGKKAILESLYNQISKLRIICSAMRDAGQKNLSEDMQVIIASLSTIGGELYSEKDLEE